MKTKITQFQIKNYTLKSFCIFLFALLLSNVTNAQCGDVSVDDLTSVGPYRVDTLRESDGIRNGPDYREATLYYPTNRTGTLASIVVIPGYNTPAAYMQRWGSFYASHGIIAFIVNVNDVQDSPNKRADALLDAIETIKRENSRSSSPLNGKVNTQRFAVSGHSLGGGGSQLAATRDSSIKAVLPLNPYLSNSSILQSNTSATLIFSGENDTTARPSRHAIPHYNNTPESTNKAIFEINNGNHQSAFSPTSSNGFVGKIALAWLKIYLEESNCYCDILRDELLTNSPIASDVDTSFSCATLSNDEFEDRSAVTIYPNPTSSHITIKNINFTSNTDYNITNLSGQLLMSGAISANKQSIDLSSLASSVYFLNIGENTFKILKTN